jgi:hypothetical protein
MSEIPVWRDTYASFGAALGLHPVTVKHMVRDRKVRAVKFGGKRPSVRLEPPEDYLRREGQWCGPQDGEAV